MMTVRVIGLSASDSETVPSIVTTPLRAGAVRQLVVPYFECSDTVTPRNAGAGTSNRLKR
eukprot:768444-Hanusia_phi.AAC.3